MWQAKQKLVNQHLHQEQGMAGKGGLANYEPAFVTAAARQLTRPGAANREQTLQQEQGFRWHASPAKDEPALATGVQV